MGKCMRFWYLSHHRTVKAQVSLAICTDSPDPLLVTIYWCTVKPVLSGHSKIDKTKILMANGSFIKVESIAECSTWSILQFF